MLNNGFKLSINFYVTELLQPVNDKEEGRASLEKPYSMLLLDHSLSIMG